MEKNLEFEYILKMGSTIQDLNRIKDTISTYHPNSGCYHTFVDGQMKIILNSYNDLSEAEIFKIGCLVGALDAKS